VPAYEKVGADIVPDSFGLNVTFKRSSGINVTLMPNGVAPFRLNVTFKRSSRMNVTLTRERGA
jgi:hypothetical protein